MTSAQRDYVAAATLDDRALFWFCAGCCGVQKGNTSGKEYLGKALKRGSPPAAVYYQLGRWDYTHADYNRALANLGRAIELDAALAPAHFYRAQIQLSECQKAKRPVRPETLGHIDRMLRIGPPCRRYTWLAAKAYAFAAEGDPSYLAIAQQHVAALLEQGQPIEKMNSDPALARVLQTIPDVKPVESTAARAVPPDFAPVYEPPESADLESIPRDQA
jgi:hypothetical protein